jgi:hypothetical protein
MVTGTTKRHRPVPTRAAGVSEQVNPRSMVAHGGEEFWLS